MPQIDKLALMRPFSDGVVVSMRTFYSNDPCSNPVEVTQRNEPKE